MAFRSEKEAAQVKYLLGDLSDQEKIGIEESYFADDDSFQELELVEDELVDAYVRGELTAAEQKQFEKLLQSSVRLSGRVKFARLLANRVAATSAARVADPVVVDAVDQRRVSTTERQTWWQKLFAVRTGRTFAFAGSAAVLLVGVALLFVWMQLREASRQLERERLALQQQKEALNTQSTEQASRINQLTADLERERGLRAEDQKLIESLQKEPATERGSLSSVVASLFLMPGLTRDASGTGRTLRLRAGQSNVRLLLSLAGNTYQSYRATIKNADGVEILHRDGLRSRRRGSGSEIAFQFSAAGISSGDYVVSVSGRTPSGLEPLTDYSFRLIQAR